MADSGKHQQLAGYIPTQLKNCRDLVCKRAGVDFCLHKLAKLYPCHVFVQDPNRGRFLPVYADVLCQRSLNEEWCGPSSRFRNVYMSCPHAELVNCLVKNFDCEESRFFVWISKVSYERTVLAMWCHM